jgi:flagellar basal-body rod protein FlgG
LLEGLYSAAAGMAAQQTRLDAVSNDLANDATPGYKPVRLAFRDLVYQAPSYGGLTANARNGAGAATAFAGRSFEQGTLQPTGRTMDVALEGPGFLQVRRADGSTALTRNGSLSLDAQGHLTTATGELLEPPITAPQGVGEEDVRIGVDGTVTAQGRTLGRLQIVDVPAPTGLQALGNSLFLPTAASGRPAAASGTTVQQGSLEASATDLSQAMVDMMDAERSFQMASRAIQVQDQVLEIANGVKK